MNKFYIVTNKMKDRDYTITKKVKSYIESKGKVCILADRIEANSPDSACLQRHDQRVRMETCFQPVSGDADCVITLGGDGTLIQAARELIHIRGNSSELPLICPPGDRTAAYKVDVAEATAAGAGFAEQTLSSIRGNSSVPLIGIHLGTLGYLTEIEVPYIEQSIDQLLQGDYKVEERMMLKGWVGEQQDYALNDIVITRHTGGSRIISFHVYVNGELLNSYQADGIIISTPTGSTAYNLSAGGPIVEPTASLIVITPICSHALNANSIVLSAEDTIMVELGEGRNGRQEQAAGTFDGIDSIHLKTGEKIYIKKAEVITKLVKLSNISFLEILRTKMKKR